MSFERDLEDAPVYGLGSVSPLFLRGMESVPNKYHPWWRLQCKTALTHPPSWVIIYPRPLYPAQLCSFPQTCPLFFLHWFPIHVLLCATSNTLLDRGQNHCGPQKMRENTVHPQRKGPLSQLWEDEEKSTVELPAEQLGKAEQYSRQKKAHNQYFMHAYWSLRILPIACIPLLSPSVPWLHPSKAEHTVSAASVPPPQQLLSSPCHYLPLPSFPSHTFGFSTFFPAWTSGHIRGLLLFSSSSSFFKWTSPVWWQKWDNIGVVLFYVFLPQSLFSRDINIVVAKMLKQKKGRFLSGHTRYLENWWVKESIKKRKAKTPTRPSERDWTESRESLQCTIALSCAYSNFLFWKTYSIHLGTMQEDSDGMQWTSTAFFLTEKLTDFEKNNNNYQVYKQHFLKTKNRTYLG